MKPKRATQSPLTEKQKPVLEHDRRREQLPPRFKVGDRVLVNFDDQDEVPDFIVLTDTDDPTLFVGDGYHIYEPPGRGRRINVIDWTFDPSCIEGRAHDAWTQSVIYAYEAHRSNEAGQSQHTLGVL